MTIVNQKTSHTMKKVMMTILAATFVGFVACNQKPAEEVVEEATEVVEEATEPAAEEATAEGEATEETPAEAPAAQ